MTKDIRMATQGSFKISLFICLIQVLAFYNVSLLCFYNAFLHFLVSKSFIISLVTLFKYKLFRKIIIFNLYMPSGPVRPYPSDEFISSFRGV